MESRDHKQRVAAAVLLALLAPALGGGTSYTAVAALMAGIGIVAIALPGGKLPAGFLTGAALVLAAMLDWAWPARFFPLPWRGRLDEAGFPLEWCVSPQPWISMRGWLVLAAGLVWAGWCAGQRWSKRDRRGICEGLAIGIGGIALAALLGRDGRVPGWPQGTGLGPFENRNQTAALFATGAFLTVACGTERLRGRRGTGNAGALVAWGFAWLCLLGVYTAALAVNRSRAGPLLFAGMTLAWAFAVMPPWKRKPETLAAGLAVGLLLATIFLLTGRGVIARLAASRLMDFRLKIFSDTLWLIRASPWTGVGLGCFNAIFPLYRNASILQERVLHPESDWLWLTAEAGLPGLLATAGLLGWMGSRAWQGIARRPDRAMQLALCVACLGVLAHSFVDVPAHRLGTMMPALLLLGLAAGEDAPGGTGWLARCAGLPVLVIGAAGLALLAARAPEPLVNGAQLLEARAARAEAAGSHAEAEAALGQALKWAPLDWRLYVDRAQLEGRHGELTAALGDFRKARFLEPNYAGLPFDEGRYWLGVAPPFAAEAWAEALRRLPPAERAELYQGMLSEAFAAHPDLHAALRSLAFSDSAMQLEYLGWATPEEFKAELGEILHADPALTRFSPVQLGRLFPLWMQKGDAPQLASLLARRPAWLKAGYRTLAEYDAANGDLAGALDLIERYLPPPVVPPVPGMGHDEAARRFEEDPGDIAAGMALYDEAIAAGRDDDALAVLRGMSGEAGCPGYVHYLEGQLLFKEGKIGDAWKALGEYGN